MPVAPSPTSALGVPGGRTPALPALELFLGLLCNSPASTHGRKGSWETSPAAASQPASREHKLSSLLLPSTKGQRRLSDHPARRREGELRLCRGAWIPFPGTESGWGRLSECVCPPRAQWHRPAPTGSASCLLFIPSLLPAASCVDSGVSTPTDRSRLLTPVLSAPAEIRPGQAMGGARRSRRRG